jgi:hypothetical protein
MWGNGFLCWASRRSGKPASLGPNAAARRKSRLSGTGLTAPSLGTDEMSDGSGAPTGPTRQMKSGLTLQVRKRRVIEAAWFAIKRNARTSKSQETKNEIAAFEENLATNLKRLSRELQQNRFVFPPARGIKIPKDIERLDQRIETLIKAYLAVYREERGKTDDPGRWRLLGIEALAQVEREPFIWPKKKL